MSYINKLIREALQVMPPGAEARNWDDLDEASAPPVAGMMGDDDNEDIQGQASRDKQKDKNTAPAGEDSPADKAHALGLTYAGYAKWKDKSGKTVAKTIGNDLVKLDAGEKLGASTNPKATDDIAPYDQDTQAPQLKLNPPELAKRHQTIQTAKNIETDPAVVGHIHPPTKGKGDAIEVTVDGKNAVLDAWEPDYSSAMVTFDDGTSKKVRPSQVTPRTPDDIKALAKNAAKSARNRHKPDFGLASQAPDYEEDPLDAANIDNPPPSKHGWDTKEPDEQWPHVDYKKPKLNVPTGKAQTAPSPEGIGDVPQNFDQDLEDMGVNPHKGRVAPTKNKKGAQWKMGSLADKYLEMTDGDIDKAVEKIRDTLKIDNSFKARKVLGRTLRDLADRKKQIPAGSKKEVEPSTPAPEAMRDAVREKMLTATNTADRQKWANALAKMDAQSRPEPKQSDATGMASQIPSEEETRKQKAEQHSAYKFIEKYNGPENALRIAKKQRDKSKIANKNNPEVNAFFDTLVANIEKITQSPMAWDSETGKKVPAVWDASKFRYVPASNKDTGMASQVPEKPPLTKMKQSDMFPEMPAVPAPGDKPTPKKPMEKPKVDKSIYDQGQTLKIPANKSIRQMNSQDFEKRLKQLHPEFSSEQVARLLDLFKDYEGGAGDGNKFAQNKGRGHKYERDK